jgi:hypothetical protein
MALLDADASKFFKKVHVDQTRIEADVLDKE